MRKGEKKSKKKIIKLKRVVTKKLNTFPQHFLGLGIMFFLAAFFVSVFFFVHRPIKIIKSTPLSFFTKSYKNAFLKKDFAAFWNLYSPSYQALIQQNVGKYRYISFLQKKFQDITIHNITFSDCKPGKTVFPYGVEKQFENTCVITLSLSLSSTQATVAAQLPLLAHSQLIIVQEKNAFMIVGGGPTDLQSPVLFPAATTSALSDVPVIMYHRIAPMPNRRDFETDYGFQLDVGLTVTPENFASQMDELVKMGYQTISPNDLFNHMYYDLPLPAHPILLTFDDGRLSDYLNGLPILLSHHFTATFFIPPFLSGKMFGYHNHNKYMSFDNLKTLAMDGMFVENHSLKHDTPLWDMPQAQLKDQLTQANTDLFSTTEYPVQFIAYPGRWPFSDWQQTAAPEVMTMQTLSQMGFALSFLDLPQNSIHENTLYPYQVSRIRPQNVSGIVFLLQTNPSLVQK